MCPPAVPDAAQSLMDTCVHGAGSCPRPRSARLHLPSGTCAKSNRRPPAICKPFTNQIVASFISPLRATHRILFMS